jgi:hypothetical protein
MRPPQTSPRDPRTAPAAEPAAIRAGPGGVGAPGGRPGRRAAPAGGAKRGPLAPVTGPAQQIERSPTPSRYSTRRRWSANPHHDGVLALIERDLTAKLTAKHSH